MEKINKLFLFFNTRATFENKLRSGQIKEGSIVFVAEDNIIWTHGVVFGGAGSYLDEYATKEYVNNIINGVEIPEMHIETSLLANSDYPVSSKALYSAISEKLDTTAFLSTLVQHIDSRLSDTSTNPVQNKTVKEAIDGLIAAQTDLQSSLQEALQTYVVDYIYNNVYNKDEVDRRLSNLSTIQIKVVDSLASVTNPKNNIIYLVLSDAEDQLYTMNVYDGRWIEIGAQPVDLDFSDYYTKQEINEIISGVNNNVLTKLGDYYTKLDIDDKLRRFYDKDYIDNVLSNYYTAQQTDGIISNIQSSMQQTNDQFAHCYTKSQIDEINQQFVKKSSVYTPDQGFGSDSSEGSGGYSGPQPNHIILEEAEYAALEQYEDDAIYFVLEPQEEINWTFGGTFPITFVESNGIGTFPITLQ